MSTAKYSFSDFYRIDANEEVDRSVEIPIIDLKDKYRLLSIHVAIFMLITIIIYTGIFLLLKNHESILQFGLKFNRALKVFNQ